MEYWQPKIEKLKRKQLDELTVRVEVTKAAFSDKLADLMKLEKKIGYELQKVLNLSTRVELVETSTLPRSQVSRKRSSIRERFKGLHFGEIFMIGTIKQISLFAENKPGRLAKIAEALSKAKVNIRAFTIAEAGDFGVIRMDVDDPDKAYKTLQGQGFTVSETDVIGVEMKDVPGGLYEIANVLGKNNVNIDYAYAFVTSTKLALLILRVDNISQAQKVLKDAGVRLVDAKEVSKI